MSNSTSTATSVPTSPSSSQAPSATTSSIPSSSFQTIQSTSVPSSSANSSPTSAPSTSLSPTTPSTSIISTTSTSSIPSTSEQQTTSQVTTPTTTQRQTTTQAPTTTQQPTTEQQTIITSVITNSENPQSVSTVIRTSTATFPTSETGTGTSSSASGTNTAGLQSGSKSSSSGGLGHGGTVAVAVVVPIVAVALIVLAGLFFWRKRKQRKDAEELRRKEVEEYGYNPNNDPTLPAVGGSPGNDMEMREDGSAAGYRGWGTTTAVSSGRKASTTLSGGQSAGGIGMAYSEGTSPTAGGASDTRSDNPLVGERPISDDAEALGAMGPAASANRNGDINRGPSNASSSYSAANRSDGSGEVPGGYGGGYYNNQYDAGNPYNGDAPYGSSPPGRAEMSAQPVIRDVQARRNTRIENPAHFPQQSAGIAQNF